MRGVLMKEPFKDSFRDSRIKTKTVRKKSSKSKNKFVRRENTYLISYEKYQDFISMIYGNIKPSYPDRKTKYNVIETLYLDSVNMQTFREHFLKTNNRFKLRIRKYVPNGDYSKLKAFLEIKYKENKLTNKTRIQIDNDEISSICRGKLLVFSEEILARNPEMTVGEIFKFIQLYNTIIFKYKPSKVIRVRYKRFEFEKKGLRITIDSELKGKGYYKSSNNDCIGIMAHERNLLEEAYYMQAKYRKNEQIIVEIKYMNSVPRWLSDYMEKEEIYNVRFSKYCWAVGREVYKKYSGLMKEICNGRKNK